MPAPSNPPFQAGARTVPRQLQRWLDVNKVNKLTRTETYFDLPAFSVDNDWLGYSQLVGVFNYTATNNFSLPLDFVVPTNPSYVLCIMWVEDDVVHRYKLWEGVGEVFYFNPPLYTGQLIKKNFRIEVWNVEPTLSTFTFNSAATAGVNGNYTYVDATSWENPIGDYTAWYEIDNVWRVKNLALNTYYYADDNGNFPFLLWQIGVGGAPAPFASVATTAESTTVSTFYTSVQGQYDYMWQDDSALATAGAIVTNFSVGLNGGGAFSLPMVWPADSVPVTN